MAEREFSQLQFDSSEHADSRLESDAGEPFEKIEKLFPETPDSVDQVSRFARRSPAPETDPHIRALGERIAVGRERFKELTGKERRSAGETMSELADVADARAARDELVERHLSQVKAIVKRHFRGKGIEYDDLIQQGNLSLLKAAERFDPDSGSFSAFAGSTIFGDLQRLTARESEIVRIPRPIVEGRPLVMTADREMEMRDAHTPTNTELAEEVARRLLAKDSDEAPTEDAVTEKARELLPNMPLLRYKTHPLYLDAPLAEGEDDHTLQDELADPRDDIGLATEVVDLRYALQSDTIDDRDREILDLRYWRNRTQAEIGAELGHSQMHISRLLTRAHAKLRDALSEEFPEES